MTILFLDGPVAGQWCTIRPRGKDLRIGYLAGDERRVAIYRLGEEVKTEARHHFASASYVTDKESAESLVDWWSYHRNGVRRPPP